MNVKNVTIHTDKSFIIFCMELSDFVDEGILMFTVRLVVVKNVEFQYTVF
jgi:hypothetical protein